MKICLPKNTRISFLSFLSHFHNHKGDKMKKVIFISGLLLTFALASLSSASGIDNATITQVRVMSNGNVIIWTSIIRTPPSCAQADNNNDIFMFTPNSAGTTYNSFLSTVLTAKSAGSIVKINGTSSCPTSTTHTTIEGLDYIQIK
jgi:hypothetical protein